MEQILQRSISAESGGVQNCSFEKTASQVNVEVSVGISRWRSLYAEAPTEVVPDAGPGARCDCSLSFVQTQLTKNGCVSALTKAENGATCWLK